MKIGPHDFTQATIRQRTRSVCKKLNIITGSRKRQKTYGVISG